MTNFNEFRFSGLKMLRESNQYWVFNRVSDDEEKIMVRVAESHLLKTKYGYALILDETHVVFIKDWQIDFNYFGNEVLLTKQYFNIKEWGNHDEFSDNEEALNWEYWLNAAKAQNEEKHFGEWRKHKM